MANSGRGLAEALAVTVYHAGRKDRFGNYISDTPIVGNESPGGDWAILGTYLRSHLSE